MKTPLLNSFKSAFVVFLLAFLLVPSILEAKVLKVLAIGNSFSEDAVEQNLYELALVQGDTLIIGNAYIPGCTLDRHWDNALTGKAEYRYRKIVNGEITTTNNVAISDIIEDEDWEIISLQQQSGNSGIPESYGKLELLKNFVKSSAKHKSVEIVWHATWAYANTYKAKSFEAYGNDQKKMFDAICSTIAQELPKVGIKRYIPNNLTIQNAREKMGDILNRDGFHLSLTIGRYAAACTWCEFLTGKSIVGNSFIPETITKEEAAILQEAAHKAVVSSIIGKKSEGYFTTDKRQLIDAEGNPFLIAGINNPHVWSKEKAYRALPDIAKTNANTVRVVWATYGWLPDLERIIKKCIELKMIPMVELHDATGKRDKQSLLDLANYYAREDVSSILKQYERFLLINIANEWGDHTVGSKHWLECYTEAVNILREAGYKTTLVVDGSGWGQNIKPILENGAELIENDPCHNILYSIHMYGSWNKETEITKKLSEVYDKELPIIVGEFGYNSKNGFNNLHCKVNHKVILQACHDLGYGFMPWSWADNNKENAWLDLVDVKDWKTPTWWGNEVLNSPLGVRNVAKEASIFGVKE